MYYIKINEEKIIYHSLNEAIKKAANERSIIYDLKDNVVHDFSHELVLVNYEDVPFIIDVSKKRYINFPIKYYEKSEKAHELEYHTGAYNYLYSKDGYDLLEAKFSLKNAVYQLSNNNTNYNGYVLFNHETKDQIDVGVVLRCVEDKVVVQPFYFYMGGTKDRVFYMDKEILSNFVKKSENTFIGEDEFKLTLKKTNSGWFFKIEVLNKDLIYQKEIVIADGMHRDYKGRFLVGVSLVPIKDDLFDPLCGALFDQVWIEEVRLNNDTYLYPSSESMKLGYSQGYPFSNVSVNGHSFICKTVYKK